VQGGAVGEGALKKTSLRAGVPAGGAGLASASALERDARETEKMRLANCIETARGDTEIRIRLYFY
jgi:hypothetical protein